MNLRPAPGPQPYGDWVLDPARSDDAGAALAKALPKRDPPPPREIPGDAMPPDDSHRQRTAQSRGDSNAQLSRASTVLMPLRLRAALAAGYVLPPARIRLAAVTDGVEVWQGDQHRLYAPLGGDGASVTDRFGTRSVRAGWVGGDFTVLSRDSGRLNVTETFRMSDADTLEREVTMRATGMSHVKVRAVYRRSVPADFPPPVEGPPPPGRGY